MEVIFKITAYPNHIGVSTSVMVFGNNMIDMTEAVGLYARNRYPKYNAMNIEALHNAKQPIDKTESVQALVSSMFSSTLKSSFKKVTFKIVKK